MRRLAILGALVITAVGCGPVTSPPESRAVVEKYLEAVKHGRSTELASLYSPEIFTSTSRDEWMMLIDKTHAKLGPLKSYTISFLSISRVSGANSGVHTTFQCNVEYEKYHAVEVFRVFQPSKGEALITFHNINSRGLVLE